MWWLYSRGKIDSVHHSSWQLIFPPCFLPPPDKGRRSSFTFTSLTRSPTIHFSAARFFSLSSSLEMKVTSRDLRSVKNRWRCRERMDDLWALSAPCWAINKSSHLAGDYRVLRGDRHSDNTDIPRDFARSGDDDSEFDERKEETGWESRKKLISIGNYKEITGSKPAKLKRISYWLLKTWRLKCKLDYLKK